MNIANQKKQRLADGIKLTEHVFGYKKMVMGELLYFGYDEPVAQSRVLRVMSIVADLKAKGQKQWTPASLTLARAIAKGQDQPAIAPTILPSPPPSVESIPAPTKKSATPLEAPTSPAKSVTMLYDAIDAFAAKCKADQTKARDHGFIGRVLAQKRAISNIPLANVGERELVGLVNFWRSKPTGTRCVYVGATKDWKVIETGKPIRSQTIKLNVGTARQMFRWIASGTSGFDWHAPNLQPIFEMRNSDVERLRTPAEKMLAVRARNDEHAEHFSLEELERLWMAASNLKRQLFFLLSLNVGCSTSELSGLLVGNCFIDGKNAEHPFIAFDRPKTGVYGKWFLWRESAQTLMDYLQPKFPYGWIDEEVESNLKYFVHNGRVYQPTGNTSPNSVSETGMTLAQWRKSRIEERDRWEKYNAKVDSEEPVFTTDEGNSLLTASPNGNRNDAVKLVWARWSATAKVTRLSWKHMRKTGSQLVRSAATDLGMSGDYMSELFLAHQAPIMSRPYNRRDNSEYDQLGRVLMEVRNRLGKVFGDADSNE